jgi:hypothetical protein
MAAPVYICMPGQFALAQSEFLCKLEKKMPLSLQPVFQKALAIFSITIFIIKPGMSQSKMRSVEELINTSEPGWDLVKEWIGKAKNKVEVLAVDSMQSKDALFKIQVTTRSPMGAIIYATGGILVDHGWIRILGSGCPRLQRSLPEWNKGKSFKQFGEHPPFLLIADDAIGGFFFLNGGGMGNDPGKVYYCSPDNLEYEPMGLSYTEFLMFCFNNDLDKYYKGLRWKGWQKEVADISGDQVFNFYPYLWTKEGKDIEKDSRKAVPIEEQYTLTMSMRAQLGIDKEK